VAASSEVNVLHVSEQPRRTGLALVELVTVVAILLLLLGIVIPMFVEARERSNRFHCQNNLRQIGQCFLAERADNKGRLPAVVPAASKRLDGPFIARPDAMAGAAFYLVRKYDLSPRLFVCPNTDASPDDLAALPATTRPGFSDPKRNLSYSVQVPYGGGDFAAGLRPVAAAKSDYVIMADLNPGIVGEDDNVLAVTPTSPPEQMRWGNSNNHAKRGQNILYADGRVDFAESPFVGVDGDNIYCTKKNTVLDLPADPDDNLLLPTDD
jgi:hypothetical protein